MHVTFSEVTGLSKVLDYTGQDDGPAIVILGGKYCKNIDDIQKNNIWVVTLNTSANNGIQARRRSEDRYFSICWI